MKKRVISKLFFPILLLYITSPFAQSPPDFNKIKDQYFVILKTQPTKNSSIKSADLSSVATKIRQLGGILEKEYHSAFVGMLVSMDGHYQNTLLNEPLVKKVVPNGIATTSDTYNWGTDRVDQRQLPLDQTYSPIRSGAGTHAYIIDSGIRVTHNEFTGRIGEGYSALQDEPANEDCNGHGTHVAGTVGGTNVGVANNVTLHSVRVFGCSGSTTWDTVIDAIEWVTANHQSPSVANLSLGGGGNDAIDEAIVNLVNSGVHTVVAAGNSNNDACLYSPARVPEAITVAASTDADERAGFSNFGDCIDIYAPGQSVNSASNTADDAYRLLSGTSMASPHVAGGVAMMLEFGSQITPESMSDLLKVNATSDVISDSKSTDDSLLYVNANLDSVFVDAGKDLYAHPNNPVTLTGKARTAFHRIISATWKEQGNPIALSKPISGERDNTSWQQTLELEGLSLGTHVFEYSAVDSEGQTGSDTVSVIVSDGRIPPEVNAGKDQLIRKRISKATLSATAEDPDGVIDTILWEQESGPANSTIETPNQLTTIVNFTESGEYHFKMTVTDNSSNSVSDTVMIYVNNLPTSDAGEDQTIQLPIDTASLNGEGTDVEEGQLAYYWQVISGPSGSSIMNNRAKDTTISGLKEGVYVLRFYVIDSVGDYAFDEMTITVQAKSNIEVDAGEDIAITHPATAVLNGSCEALEGKCVQMEWRLLAREIATQNDFDLNNPGVTTSKSTLTIPNLPVGHYEYQLTAWDSAGNSASDTVTVTVS